MKKMVKFKAHKLERVPTEVTFETKDGTRVDFKAHKKEKVPVNVKFKADA